MPKRSSKPKDVNQIARFIIDQTADETPPLAYQAKVTREGKHWLAEFPDCPGCQTFAKSEAELRLMASEALDGWLSSHLADGETPPKPSAAPTDGAWSVSVAPSIAGQLRDRWAGKPGKDPAAAALGRLGGLKGGAARAASLSKAKRSAIAKKAAKARWG